MGTLVEDGHVGGFRAGGDPGTYYPQLWDWMVNELGVRSVLDVGCGEGHALRHFRNLGCDVLGLDGSRKAGGLLAPSEFVLHDLVSGPYLCGRRFDAAWCCEVAEHVEERHAGDLMSSLVHSAERFVFFTHALPGQGGYHHVNCRPPEYWIERFRAAGCVLEQALTARARLLAHGYFSRTGLVFVPEREQLED